MPRIASATLISLCMLNPLVSFAGKTEPAEADWSTAITAVAADNRYKLNYDGQKFSGPAWDRLVQEGRQAQFFLIGEEHGIAENPGLAAQLFSTLSGAGYRRLVIEISPPMAQVLDDALLQGGTDAVRRLFGKPGGEPAFFGMAEEVEMLARVREVVPDNQAAFWGVDYEVAGDRTLLRILQTRDKPAAAQDALNALVKASEESWSKYAETGGPQYIFSFAGDPALVRAVREAWLNPDEESDSILETLEKTLEINRLWGAGSGWASNQRRAALLRANFLRHWNASGDRGGKPRVMAKLGASHLVRGLNMTQTFDLGTLLPELAAQIGEHSVSMMVLPGKDSLSAVLDPSAWRYEPKPPKDEYAKGIEPLIAAAFADEFTLIDLRPLRGALARHRRSADPELVRVVYGFDLLLVMSGSTPSSEFAHD